VDNNKMNIPKKHSAPRFIIVLLAILALISCNFLTNLVSNPSPLPSTTSNQGGNGTSVVAQNPSGGEEPNTENSGGTPTVTEQVPAPNENATAEPDPLDHLMNLRSVVIHLTSQRPDDSSSSTQVEIDSAGNMHVKYSLPAQDPKLLPSWFDISHVPTANELFVVDGKAYQHDDSNPAWMITPIDEHYVQTLSEVLHGPDGVAEWLDILPNGSLTSAGQESVGGFETDKYTVNGMVDGKTIIGGLWYEPQSDALIKADLHVPAAIYDVTDNSLTGELTIDLDTQQSDVPLVTLPTAAPGVTVSTATVTAEVTATETLTPAAGSVTAGRGTHEASYSKALGETTMSCSELDDYVWGLDRKGTVYETIDTVTGAWLTVRVDETKTTCPGFRGATVVPVNEINMDDGSFVDSQIMDCDYIRSYKWTPGQSADSYKSRAGGPIFYQMWASSVKAACPGF
jgi:hypothetical protein